MITLKDVAREAGVSIATVSCALSGKKAVRPETYTKIMDAVEKLKYIPNYSARNLKKKSQQYGKRAASGNEKPVLLRAL